MSRSEDSRLLQLLKCTPVHSEHSGRGYSEYGGVPWSSCEYFERDIPDFLMRSTLAIRRRPGGDYIAAISLVRVGAVIEERAQWPVLIRGIKIKFIPDSLITKGESGSRSLRRFCL